MVKLLCVNLLLVELNLSQQTEKHHYEHVLTFLISL